MDRVAQLAEEADACIRAEHSWSPFLSDAANREVTRKTLEIKARELGFPELEISAAIDTALAGR